MNSYLTTRSLYNCENIKASLDAKAKASDGELTPQDIQDVTLAYTESQELLGELCEFYKDGESFIDVCKKREAEIADMRKKAEARMQTSREALLPFLEKNGKQDIGLFRLSTRKSQRVEIDTEFFDKDQSSSEYITIKPAVRVPDKKAIKQAIKNGEEVQGASVVDNVSVTFK